MSKIILITQDELREMLEVAIRKVYESKETGKNSSDNLALDEAVVFLKENGYPTSKAKLYKLTAANQIAHSKFGNKLMFSRKYLLEWANQNTSNVTNNTDGLLEIARSANHKNRRY